ncbi:hypothetical protein SPI_04632 [Niveomyces insectorum RCEF 264]|uniref:Uncharacterized protein n=1 Tax=Niveomyces insectorum RCEF 264 TaxID=1081102 RepID=A0A167UPH7_9HYPO|nr:hypothetical protein SPI_04632 [Niveomyces insectorum RCEF 264]
MSARNFGATSLGSSGSQPACTDSSLPVAPNGTSTSTDSTNPDPSLNGIGGWTEDAQGTQSGSSGSGQGNNGSKT